MRRERDDTTAPLPAPTVELPADYRARLERCVPHLSASLERREGGGRALLPGGGLESVGHRPYRVGDDPRAIDWNLYARLEQPWVRILRREARERWLVLVDASASMGVGPPGKLQRAAELAGALVLLGLRRGGEVALARLGAEELVFARRAPQHLAQLCDELASWRAQGSSSSGGARELARHARAMRNAGRVFFVGDPFGVSSEAWSRAASLVRASHVIHLLAPLELETPDERAIEWLDPEADAADGTGAPRKLSLELDDARRAAYARSLGALLESWRARASGAARRHTVSSTQPPFEAILRAALPA